MQNRKLDPEKIQIDIPIAVLVNTAKWDRRDYRDVLYNLYFNLNQIKYQVSKSSKKFDEYGFTYFFYSILYMHTLNILS
jgi:hypothetical protein